MSKFVQSKDVAWNFLGEGIVAFSLDGEREFHDLNETAAVIFQALEFPRTKPELVNALLAEFEVDADQASTDVEFALSEMRSKKLIVEA